MLMTGEKAQEIAREHKWREEFELEWTRVLIEWDVATDIIPQVKYSAWMIFLAAKKSAQVEIDELYKTGISQSIRNKWDRLKNQNNFLNVKRITHEKEILSLQAQLKERDDEIIKLKDAVKFENKLLNVASLLYS